MRQQHQRWGLFASWTQPWCWCWRCFWRWRGPAGCGRCCCEKLVPFLDDTKRLVLMGDWNAILDPKIDKFGRGANRLGRCESSLVGFVTRHGLVDRFRLDHPGREMWTWLDSSPSAKVGSYLDRVLVRRADIDFVSCPTFHLIAWTDHKLISVSLRLVNRPSLAGYWKFNTPLLEIRDFRDRLESLIQRALVGAVTGNRWWASLKHRIRDFATKYGRQLNLDRTAEVKSIEDRLSRAVARGDSLGVELARRDLERESSECYKGSVVRSRLKRVLNEAVKSNATEREEEVRRFPDRYIASVKTPDGRLLRSGREIRDAFRAHFGIALPAALISRSGSFVAISPTSPALGRLKRLAARVWLLNAKSVTRWSRPAWTRRRD